MEYLLTDIAMTFIGIVLFGLLVFFAEAERLWSSVILVALTLIFAQWVAGIAVFAVFLSNPILVIAGILAYVILGAAYTTYWEWPKYCKRNADPVALESYLNAFPEHTEDDYYSEPRRFKLHPKNHVTRLGHIVLHWPFLLFWTLLSDPITWFYNFMYDLLGGFLHKVAVKVTKSAVEASRYKTEP